MIMTVDYRIPYARICTWLLLMCLPLLLHAQRNNFTTTPAPSWLAPYTPDLHKKPNLHDISSGYYLLLLEEQHHAEQKSVYRHIIRQIVSEAGVQHGAEISVDYDPAYEQLRFHQLVIRRNGKVINRLSAGRFRILQQEKELSRFIYSGMYTAYCIIDDVRKGDQIEYAYTITGRNPIFEDKYFRTFYFVASEPIVNYYKCLITAPARNIQFRSFNNAPLPDKRSWQGMTLYEWQPKHIAEPETVPYNTPSWYDNYARVQASEYTSWAEVVNWALQVNATHNLSPALQQKVAAWQKETGDNKALYMQKAIRFVQDDIRYMGIEMGEYSHRPSPPEKILSRRFGDCKDKSLLLCTLLQANAIDACMAYVDTYTRGKLADYLPSPVLFNHVIVNASLSGNNYWIDPTINYQRGTIDNLTVPDYQLALLVKKGARALSPIPQSYHGTVRISESFVLPENNEKPAKLQVLSNYSLQFADGQREDFAENSMKDQEEAFLKYYKGLYGDVRSDTGVQIDDQEAEDRFETAEYYTIHHPWATDTTTPSRRHFHVQARILTDMLPRVPKDNHTQPLALKYPYSLDYTITLQVPSDWSIENSSMHVKNKYYRIDFTSGITGRMVTLHYQYTAYQDHVPVNYLTSYVDDRNQLADIGGFDLYWDPSATGTSAAPAGHKGVSWVMVALCLMFTGVFSYAAMRFYQRSVLPVQYNPEAWAIGGWLFLLGFGIVFSPVSILINILGSGFFNNANWENINHAQDGQVRLLVFIGELAGNVFLCVYATLLVLLFVKKRDTFPAACIVFYAATLTVQLLDYIVVGALNKNYAWSHDQASGIFRSIIAAAIWIPYLLKSERVRKTFIIPHSSKHEEYEM
ncbi:MAG TPA: DUF3857 domain-containing protein [Chitinophaga sp.]|uniref:DUF3857 domain-containing protein n=1 Tax=Chitinophaga sp. TaxID=1869181 RepID=UPI002DBCAE24|nr:DUF3857 domain-containing protein [Chitinophaga sp.]HEU4555275.1 DUF3857 domain-containing protein [Chitinophaga sp.]